nr:transcriptional regulator AcuR-like [Nerophis lumbriciformis]
MASMSPGSATVRGQATRAKLLAAGRELMLEQGFSEAGILELLRRTELPKGSFYHHFRNKEDFGLQVLDAFAAAGFEQLHEHLTTTDRSPLARLRTFFDEAIASYEQAGWRQGCLLGICAQELAESSEPFRRKVAAHLEQMSALFSSALQQAQQHGEIDPVGDPAQLGRRLVDGWQGALLRMKVDRRGQPLREFVDFFFSAIQLR